MTKLLESKNTIFKYVPFNTNSIKNLINAELWFGKPKNQNDPYEGEFIIDGFTEPLTQDIKWKLIKEIFRNEHEILLKKKYEDDLTERRFLQDYSNRIIELIKDLCGICCFSHIYNEILLWTHYSDSHSGMCLVFDKNLLDKCLIEEHGNILYTDTVYHNNVPRLKIELDKGIPFINGYSQLKNKMKNFEYEKEYRYIAYFDPRWPSKRNINFDKNSLKGIIFGENMAMDNRRTIVNLFKSIPDYNNVDFYISTKNIVDKAIRIEIINEKHPDYYELFKDQGAKQIFHTFGRAKD